jgi:para-aminobenzoate synthetase/4-amino-4-deoxychorismate lyase
MAKEFTSPQRVRILASRSGEIRSEIKSFHSEEKLFKVCLAEDPIDSSNVLFFHKTTRRDIYPIRQGYDDVLLFNEKNELTEFTIGNLVAETNGQLFTPPVSCGLLAGTFRAHLLESGRIKERVIRKDELGNYSRLFLVNSVRKWVDVRLNN